MLQVALTMSVSPPEALIVGGGIAGLSSAITLGRQGWRCSILERDPQRRRKGQGLLLPPSGHQALRCLAVEDIAGCSAAIDRYELCQPDGRLDQEFPIAGARSLLHRDLLVALQRSLPASVRLVAGRCRGLEPAADGDWLGISDDLPPLRADLIVAADGIGSVCRRQLFPQARLTQERTTELVLVTRDPVLVRQLTLPVMPPPASVLALWLRMGCWRRQRRGRAGQRMRRLCACCRAARRRGAARAARGRLAGAA